MYIYYNILSTIFKGQFALFWQNFPRSLLKCGIYACWQTKAYYAMLFTYILFPFSRFATDLQSFKNFFILHPTILPKKSPFLLEGCWTAGFSTEEIAGAQKKIFEEFCVQALRFCPKKALLSEGGIADGEHGAVTLKTDKEKFFEKFFI